MDETPLWQTLLLGTLGGALGILVMVATWWLAFHGWWWAL